MSRLNFQYSPHNKKWKGRRLPYSIADDHAIGVLCCLYYLELEKHINQKLLPYHFQLEGLSRTLQA